MRVHSSQHFRGLLCPTWYGIKVWNEVFRRRLFSLHFILARRELRFATKRPLNKQDRTLFKGWDDKLWHWRSFAPPAAACIHETDRVTIPYILHAMRHRWPLRSPPLLTLIPAEITNDFLVFQSKTKPKLKKTLKFIVHWNKVLSTLNDGSIHLFA